MPLRKTALATALMLGTGYAMAALPTLNWNQGQTYATATADRAAGLKVDGAGDLLIQSTEWDHYRSALTLAKYAPDGTELWRNTYTPPCNNYGWCAPDSGIAIDSGNNLYVQQNYSTGWNKYQKISKVDASGQVLWSVDRVGYSNAKAMVVDAEGNLYVLNTRHDGFSTTGSVAVSKYHPDGTLVWEVQEPGHYRFLAISDSGQLTLAGSDPARFSPTNIAHLNQAGEITWRGAYDDGSGMHRMYDIRALPGGEVLALGVTYSQKGFWLVKYDATGAELWRRGYDTCNGILYYCGATPVAIDLDPSNNPVVLARGWSTPGSSSGNTDVTVVKYDLEGNLLWDYQYDNGLSETPKAVQVDHRGNIHAVYELLANGSLGLLAFDQSGQLLSEMETASLLPLGLSQSRMTLDGLDHIYLAAQDSATGGLQLAQFQTAAGDTQPPELSVPADVTVEATGVLTPVVLEPAAAFDLVDGPVPVTSDQPDAGFPLGATIVTYQASDSQGNTATGQQQVSVIDTTAPELTVPEDLEVVATGTLTTLAIGQAGASDLFGPVEIAHDAPAAFPIGTTTVAWSATDANGNVATASQQVGVRYAFGGFASPLREGGVYKRRGSLPVKFTLAYADGAAVLDASPTLSVQMLDGDVPAGDPIEISATNDADNTGSFRLSDDTYIFNLDTGALAQGSYRLSVELYDGSAPYTIDIGLKQ